MPYFTKKGTGKNKGKTCVYKKSSKKKVGCTAGPVEKYLTALRMAESEDLEWILDEGKDKTYIIEKLKETFKEYGVYVDWDLDYDRNVNPDGYYEEYFGRFWYEATGGRAYFIDLYESSEGFFFRLYKLDETDDQYYIDDTYSQQYTLEKEADKFCLLVAFLVLNQCGKLKSTRSFINKTSVNESELSWIEDLEPEFNATMLRYGQKFKNKWGDIIRTIMFIEQDDYEVSYEKPMTGLTFKIVDDPSGYRPYPSHPKDHPLNSELTFNPIEFDRGLRSGQLIPMFTDEEFRLKESEGFDWVDLQSDRPLHNVTFKVKGYPEIYTIKDDGLRSSVKLTWTNDFGEKQTSTYMRDTVNKYFKKGIWEPFEGTITESSDLEWIQKQEPERVIKKSKSYGIDVRHLKSEPPNSPLSPRYNDLTKEDILDKLRDLGYNVSDIDVDSATYFYVEPSDDAGYWEDDVTWVKQDHWVDYETTEKDDPTFGGKYEMIDVDEFMFLIDNNLITESDFDWLDMGEPMSICEAQHKLNVGDTIIVSYLGAWLDSSGEDLIDADNATATVLAIDDCNKIHTTNTSNDKTILIHVNEPYTGFDEDWVRDFKPKYQKPCMDGRCMFLICGDKDFKDTKITKLPSKIFGENKKPINEVAGISFETRKWAEIIYNEIISNPEEKTRLIIDGYDHPEAFDGFPIDYVVVDFYDRLTGYGQEHSGYDKDGNYVVLLYVQPKLVSGQGGYSLQSALNHEMKHAWEDYNRLSKGLPSIEQTKESQQLYNRDYILMLSDQNIRGPIKEILKYYYYLSNLEKSAYLENVYDQNPVYERVVRDIASKDFESFKDRFDLDVNWHLMNTAYNIPFLKKFKSPREFIDYSAEELRSRALKMIKKMNKMKYIHGKM